MELVSRLPSALKAICPETNKVPPLRIAWEYGPIGAATLSVKITSLECPLLHDPAISAMNIQKAKSRITLPEVVRFWKFLSALLQGNRGPGDWCTHSASRGCHSFFHGRWKLCGSCIFQKVSIRSVVPASLRIQCWR